MASSACDLSRLDWPERLAILGRGRDSARALDAASAAQMLRDILAGRCTQAQLGAWWLAMRLKGESAEELTGFASAMHDTLAWRLPAEIGERLVLIPAYNGARRLANATPLLAHALARAGLRVLVHGIEHDPTRLTTANLWRALGWPWAETATACAQALSRHQLCFVPLRALHPSLQALLDKRWEIGVRSTPHTLAKLLAPLSPGHRAAALLPVTHSDYLQRLQGHAAERPGPSFVYRGLEGEAAPHPRRPISVHICQNGHTRMQEWRAEPCTAWPETVQLEPTCDWIEAVIAASQPMPEPIQALTRLISETIHEPFSAS